MMKMPRLLWGALLVLPLLAACQNETPRPASPQQSPPLAPRVMDAEFDACRAKERALLEQTALPGAPEFEARRADILGRARGEPMLFVREPKATTESDLPEAAKGLRDKLASRSPFARVVQLKRVLAKDRAALRALLLREGYVYATEPQEALALVTRLELTDLFDEDVIYLHRGSTITELRRKQGRPTTYRDPRDQRAELLFGDRVAAHRADLTEPLHRDARGLQFRLGFERLRVKRATPAGLLADLRLGGAWTRTVLDAKGAELSLGCFLEPKDRRSRIEKHLASEAPRRKALARLRSAVSSHIEEGLPFDRPRGEETADRDGQLRPAWRWAYMAGRQSFEFEENWYPVYDASGRPHPPQVCVDFVLDSYERASDTWFTSLGQKPERKHGKLDFNEFGITNRRGVLALEDFAESKPEIFEHRRFADDERIKFRDRDRFFAFLVQHADRFRPGDVVAIQGVKNDGKIHQHAILIENTDPITGFPDGLADQMKRPRRRTWEGIMAEAPLRSLLYQLRPKDGVLLAAGG
ncbi:MAG: hypothetical protein R3B13_05570 [Polyangiaceae bacterium]